MGKLSEARINRWLASLYRYVRPTRGTLPAVLWLAVALLACGNPQGATGPSATSAPPSPRPTASPYVSIDIWPPEPRSASAFMLSTWVAPFTQGQADFYSWDGSYLRTVQAPGSLLASVDGRYFVNFTTNQLFSSTGQLVRDFTEPDVEVGSTTLNWASDGDYFCGLESGAAGYSVVVEDVAGHFQRFHIDVPTDLIPPDGLRSMGIDCSLTGNRALVFGGTAESRVALMSLPDGQPIADFQFDSGYWWGGVSPDLRWVTTINSANGGDTEVVDLTTGTIQAHLNGYFDSFTPDSQHLVGTDGQGAASVVDWRTKNELWRGLGHVAMIMAHSDPSTNKVLLWLSTGSTQGGTDTYDYWIVDASGSSLRFNARSCASFVASAARVC